MQKYISLCALIIALACSSLYAFESDTELEIRQPLSLQELAANACVIKAAQDNAFFEKLTQTKNAIPFKSSLLFTKTYIAPMLPRITEIIVSPAAGLVITRDMHNKAAVHIYDEKGALRRISPPHSEDPSHPLAQWDHSPAVLASSDLNTEIACIQMGNQLLIPRKVFNETPGQQQRLDLRLGTSSFVNTDFLFFSSNNGSDVFLYDHSTATIKRILFKGHNRILKLHYRLPKHDLYAISSDGTLFVGVSHKDQKEKSKMRLFDIKKPFNPHSASNAQKEIEQPLVSLTLTRMHTIAISPDNQEIACLPLLKDLRTEDNAAYVQIHAISALLNHKKTCRELFCPDRATPSCITWVGTDRIALGSNAGHISLHQRETGKQMFEMQSHNLCVTALAHDPVRNILIAGYAMAKQGQIHEVINLNNAQELSNKQQVIVATLYRACTDPVLQRSLARWSRHFEAAKKELPEYAQQLINTTMTPSMRYHSMTPFERDCLNSINFNCKAKIAIEKSASRMCNVQ